MTERILKMPRLGETMEEGKIVGFLVEPGDSFKRGDSIIEIETDKTVAEFPALGDGKLVEWIGVIGDHVVVGAPLARIDIGAANDWTNEGDDEPSLDADNVVSPSEGVSVAQNQFVITDLEMPRLGETMEEGRLIRWLKAAGEAFERGDAILEIETDKTVAEFPALASGKLLEILRFEGEMVNVGDVIGRIEVEAGADVVKSEPQPFSPKPINEPAVVKELLKAEEHNQRTRATPLARKLARQNGIDIHAISGSGRLGRVEKADVLRAAASEQGDTGLSFVDLPLGRVAYRDVGSRDARTFLLLHGFSGDSSTWTAIASGLRRAGYRVIVPDLPAHGRTTIDAATLEELYGFLPLFLEKLGAGQVDIVAHSLGAVAAVEFAAANSANVRSLTLIAPAGLGSQIDASFITGMAHATCGGEITHLLRRVVAKPSEISAALAAEFALITAKGRLKALTEAVVGASGQRADIIAGLDKISRTLPVRILFGTQDRIIPWQQVTSLPPSVGVHFLSQSGHMPQWDQTKDVLELILKTAGDRI